jgi:glycerol dehydrogenase
MKAHERQATQPPPTTPVATSIAGRPSHTARGVRLPGGIRTFGAMHRYYQGPGALSLVGDVACQLGRSALLVCDTLVHRLVHDELQADFRQRGAQLDALVLDGEMTRTTVARGLSVLQTRGAAPDVVIAAGGGKGVDLGKAVAHELAAALIVVPTAASNDGPCSRYFVRYDHTHQLESVGLLRRSPDAVIVDTRLLVRAPKAMLLSGIGDALAKLYEGEQSHRSGAPNSFGGSVTITAAALLHKCDVVIRADAVAAVQALDTGKPDEAFERLTEALVLLSGLAFENSGLSIAHSLTRGLPQSAAAALAPHGQQVAYGLMVQWQLERRASDFMQAQRHFYKTVGLAATLSELGETQVTDALLGLIAEATFTSPHIANFERALGCADLVQAMQALEQVRHADA